MSSEPGPAAVGADQEDGDVRRGPDGGDAERPVPVEALDRCLAPIRRVASWASAAPDDRVPAVRFLEEIGGSWLARARALDLPAAVGEQLALLGDLVEGYDGAELAERHRRVVAMDQIVRRLDAQLGLPVPVPLVAHRPAVPLSDLLQPEEGEEAGTREGRGRGKRRREREGKRKRRTPEPTPEPEPPPPAEPPPEWWNGDLSVSLSDLDLPEELVDALADEDIQTVGHLLRRRPVGEEELAPVHGAGREVPEGRVAIGGRVGVRYTRLRPDASRVNELVLRGAGRLVARFSEAPSWQLGTDAWLQTFVPDKRVVVVGTLITEDTGPALLDPEPATDDGHHSARVPHYGIEGVHDRALRALIERLLDRVDRIADPLPAALTSRLQLPTLGMALAEIHHRGGAARSKARDRLAFEELLLAQLPLSCRRFQAARDRGIPHVVLHGLTSRLAADDFLLDDEQQLALEDIKRDLRQQNPMMRVLTGEVGVGKGTVATVTAIMVAESKSQVLFLAPDRAAAEQRFAFAEPLLRETGLVARLVEDGTKRGIRDAVARGEVHIVFGSLDLLESGLEFRRLGLVIAEERERWGHAARLVAKLRAPRPHALIVPPTPIGAAVAMTAYPEHDVTVIGSAGRRPVAVEVLSADERRQAYARAAEAVDAGRQVMVVFPMVSGTDALSLREAMRVVHALEDDAFQGARVALFHGSMQREERQRIYDDFRHRRSDVLVATTLVEDGPTVPDASVVLVEQADRVERARLQRIRGFVSRARHDAVAVLVVGEMSDPGATERLQRLVDAPDGFQLHEELVAQHGIDELVVEEHPPLPTLAWADLAADRELSWRAREVAHDVLRSDPGLRRGWSVELAREARSRFDELWPSEDGEGSSWRCPIPDGSTPDRRKRRRRRRKR